MYYSNSTYTTDHSDEWADILISNIEKNELPDFNMTEWNYKRIKTALETPDGITEFLKYKLQTKPTTLTIPPAISLKFKHLDTTFFTTLYETKAPS